MAEQSDPVRWLHPGSDAPGELRRALESAKADGGGPGALASLAARLPLSGAAPLPGPAAAGAVKKAIAAWKVALWVAGAAALGGGAANLIALAQKAPTVIVVAAAAPSLIAPAACVPVPEPVGSASILGADSVTPAGPPLGESVTPPAAEAPRARRPPGSAAVAARPVEAPSTTHAPAADAAPPSTPGDSLTAEARLLLHARAEVARDPRKALGLAEDHGAAFADGALGEEREVIRIDALVRLGRLDEAEAAAAVFRSGHPRSSHLARVEHLVRAAH